MSKPKFIVDVNAGRLVKWLRIAGYDTAFAPGINDGRPCCGQGKFLKAR